MGCRCAERREIIKQATAGKVSLKEAATFVVKTSAQDLNNRVRLLTRR